MRKFRKKDSKKIRGRIGHLVCDLRKKANLTQSVLSKSIGLEQSSLSLIENGKRDLTAVQWFMLCDKLKVSPDLLSDA